MIDPVIERICNKHGWKTNVSMVTKTNKDTGEEYQEEVQHVEYVGFEHLL